MKYHYTNDLIHSTSPYLLQHAHNPVNWQPWSDKRIKNEQKSDKLLLVSIGYAACHWCHVMEHESFEDEEVARVMNENFVCIKVDREERPDVDHYYMSAVHLMGLQGGWPLNVIALPDGRPVWGGTYFPKKTWMNNILSVARFWNENRDKTLEYAGNLQNGISELSVPVAPLESPPFNREMIDRSIKNWKERFDFENGGRMGQPKFPMPVNLDFLLYYGHMRNDSEVLNFVKLTLLKMAFGGIYDQLGGGFARYSVDDKWKVPHFEKMLYDNGQLISLFSKGYQKYKAEDFKRVVYETVAFLEREMSDETGAFYSSLDADSEGEEGKYYVWKQQELKDLLNEDFELFSHYFNVNSKGFWEQGNYILLREMPDDDFAGRNDLSSEELQDKVSAWKKLLLKERNKRIRPGLDDKTLASWNALVIQGLTDAFKAFNDEYFRDIATKNARFVKKYMTGTDGKLFHSWKQGKSEVNGFLEDYALVIQAFISLFEISGDEEWLNFAQKLMEYTFVHFYDDNSGLFYFSEKYPEPAVTNHFQNEDNVISASNSVMANNLHRLYLLLGSPEYLEKAKKMLSHITPHFEKYPHGFANWGTLMLKLTENYFEVAICGENAEDLFLKMQQRYKPNAAWAYAKEENSVPMIKGRCVDGKSLIYVCREGYCRLPVAKPDDALEQMK